MGVYQTKTEDRRPKIENEDEDTYNKNSIQSRFSTSSVNRSFSGKLLMNKRKSRKLSAKDFGLRFAG